MSMFKKTGGFTLVELIVVIAILAILAGVAVPAYSGYIQKADRAADEQLLAAINKAYAAACVANGDDIYLVGRGEAKLNSNGTIAYVARATEGDAYGQAFDTYFEGNEDAAFKIITEIDFDPIQCKFVDVNDMSSMIVTVNGKQYEIKHSSIKDFKDATVFADNVDDLQTQVNSLSGAFGEIVSDKLTAGQFGADFVKYLEDNNIATDDYGNAAVLYIAQNAAGKSSQEIASTFNKIGGYILDNPDKDIVDVLLNSDPDGDALTNAAMLYGAITAYASQPGNEVLLEQAQGVTNGEKLLQLFENVAEDPDFVTYVGTPKQDGSGEVNVTDQFNTDIQGFLGAMDAINTVSPGILEGGISSDTLWSDPTVEDLLTDILGSGN